MEPVASGLTYHDLVALPDDGARHELIAGDHFVTPSPSRPHQDVVGALLVLLHAWAAAGGGKAYVSPMDVRLSEETVLQPDLLALRADRVKLLEDQRFVEVAPDLVVEVSSPSTRGYDLIRKRHAYQRHGVAEFWFVDLDAQRIEVHVLDGGDYGPPAVVRRGEVATSAALDGLAVDVEELFGAL